MNNNVRGLCWCLLLYPQEDESHKRALEYIESNYKQYAYINHDKDFNENGDLKKQHTHIVIKFINYRWRNAIACELGITPNYIEKCHNIDNALKYLIHFDDSDKYQYSIEEVHGTLYSKLFQIINHTDLTESEKLLEIMSFIEHYSGFLSIHYLMTYLCSVPQLLPIYKKYYSAIHQIVKEHNIDEATKRRTHFNMGD